MLRTDFLQQRIERQCLPVHTCTSTLQLVSGLNEVPVVVPFDVVQLVLGQEREDLLPDVFVRLGDADVKGVLDGKCADTDGFRESHAN